MRMRGHWPRAASLVALTAAMMSAGVGSIGAQDSNPAGRGGAGRDQGRDRLLVVGRPGPQRQDRQDPAALREREPGRQGRARGRRLQPALGEADDPVGRRQPAVHDPDADPLARDLRQAERADAARRPSRAGRVQRRRHPAVGDGRRARHRRQALHDPLGRLHLRADAQPDHGRRRRSRRRRAAAQPLHLEPARRVPARA